MASQIKQSMLVLLLGGLATLSAAPVKKTILHLYGLGNWNHGTSLTEASNAPKAMLDALLRLKEKYKDKYDFTIVNSSNMSELPKLSTYSMVIFNNTSENAFLTNEDKAYVKNYFENGGVGIGLHAACDSHGYWEWWAAMCGGVTFTNHETRFAFNLSLDKEVAANPDLVKMYADSNLGTTANIPQTEMYVFKADANPSWITKYNSADPRGRAGITMLQYVKLTPSLTLFSGEVLDYRPQTWLKTIGKGKYIYTGLGHGINDFGGERWMDKALIGYMKYLWGEYAPPTAVKDAKLGNAAISISNESINVGNGSSHSVNVINVNGKSVFSKNGNGPANYSLKGLTNGFYFVTLKIGKNNFKKTLFIQ